MSFFCSLSFSSILKTMNIHPIITWNALQNVFYILEYTPGKALVIDPSETKICQDFLDENKLSIERILITHEHYDHYEWVVWLACGDVWAGEICADSMSVDVTHRFQDGDIVFSYEDISLRAIHTPGHADGHMMFELSQNGKVVALFSGDALFAGGVGHTRRGSSEELYNSIQKFSHYSDDVLIYPGHDYLENNAGFIQKYFPEKCDELQNVLQRKGSGIYFTRLWEERKYNPFLWEDVDAFIQTRELRNTW